MNKTKVKINGRPVFNRSTNTEIVKQNSTINGRQVYSSRHIKQFMKSKNGTFSD